MVYTKKKLTSIKCPRCKGTGKYVFVAPSNKMSTFKKGICTKCGGRGIFLKKNK